MPGGSRMRRPRSRQPVRPREGGQPAKAGSREPLRPGRRRRRPGRMGALRPARRGCGSGRRPPRSLPRSPGYLQANRTGNYPGVDLVRVQHRVGERPTACPSSGYLVAAARVSERVPRSARGGSGRVENESLTSGSSWPPENSHIVCFQKTRIGVHAAAAIFAAARHSMTRTDRHGAIGSHLQPVDARAGDAPPERNPGSPCQVPTAGRERDHRMLGDKYPRRSRGTDRRRHQSDARRQRGREHKQATPPPPRTVRRRNH